VDVSIAALLPRNLAFAGTSRDICLSQEQKKRGPVFRPKIEYEYYEWISSPTRKVMAFRASVFVAVVLLG
jgi:hypothetical protein